MENKVSIRPKEGELPSRFADRLGSLYATSVNQRHKKINGQFFTSVDIADLMASYSEYSDSDVRILDPGCGTGVLSCALIEHLVDTNKRMVSIELVAYETDPELIPTLEQSFTFLRRWCEKKRIKISTIIHTEDFILHNFSSFEDKSDLFLKSKSLGIFDIVLSNPPYFKLSIDDKRAKIAKIVINGHPNIYAIFMALSAKLLKENGELIFITPRSYAAGKYFKIFREFFFNLIDLDKVHLFVSRRDTFSRDKVLQETVIIKGVKRFDPQSHVTISSSSGLKDLKNPSIKVFPKKDIIDLNSNEKILYLPTTDYDEAVLEIFKKWTGNLAKYDIKISTGPVVAFRARDYLRENFQNDTAKIAPLFWLHNVKQMALEWPIAKPRKEQYINIEEKSRPLLISNKNYIFLRRFSSKDDKNRLIAAPYFCDFTKSEYIGVENKVNYIYRPKGRLKRKEVIGLCSLLNSSLFDTYFRIFNGNVNVSATELRDMALPPLEIIQDIGEIIIYTNDFSIANTNNIVNKYLEPTYSI